MSNLFKLDIKDAVKGLVVAVLASVLIAIYGAVTNNMAINWNDVLKIAISSGLGYVVKNYFTDESGKLLGKL